MSAEKDNTAVAPVAAAEATTPVAAPEITESPLTKLSARLPEITKTAGHAEMWGVQLSVDAPAEHIPTTVVLQKFLRANNNDVAAAEKQLGEALKWRKDIKITELLTKEFDEKRFGGLGYVSTHSDKEGKETAITYNVYGAVTDNKATFGNVEEFIEWRATLMELGVQKLKLASVTKPIPEGGEDPYQMVQVHDYLSVAFLRMDPNVKAASSKTITVLSMAYPELLAHKYFVNVPMVMGWMYAAMKLFLAPATLKKFHPMSDGKSLVNELRSIEDTLPVEYGGKGKSVKEAQQVGTTVQRDEIVVGSEDAPVAAVNEPRTEYAKVEETKGTEEIEKKLEETKITDEPKVEEVKAEEVKPAAEPEKKE